MLSFYDALSFSVQKKSLFSAICMGTIMLLFALLIGFSVEVNFSFFTAFKNWLQSPPGSSTSFTALGQLALILKDPLFWGLLFQKVLWFCFLFFFCAICFFAFELVIAKKALFNQPPHFTASFFFITLGKLLLLTAPISIILYIFLYEILKSGFGFIAGTVIGLNPTYQFPFSIIGTIIVTLIFITYFIYTTLLFIGRFSFASLLHCSPFFKNLKTVGELILKILLALGMLFIGWTILGLIIWQIESLYVCFAALMAYLIWMLVLNKARFILMIPFWIMGALAIGLYFTFGGAFFSTYLFTFMIGTLTYYCFFLFWFIFWGTLAHLFGASAFVFRFEKTPAKDIKKQSPEKLKRMDELYDSYLKVHKNDSQDNYFHHLEEKR